MTTSKNTELNPKKTFLEPLESASYHDRNNPSSGQDINVNSHIISFTRNFESEPFNEFSYHFEQEYTSTDI